MKAAVVISPGVLEVREIEEPKINDYQALIKIIACATCNSTDLRIINNSANYPLILGHESVGRVIETGKNVLHFKKGDLVLRPMAAYPDKLFYGYSSCYGGFAEYGIVTDCEAMLKDGMKKENNFNWYELNQQKIPQDFDPVDSTMIVTFREVLDWSQKFEIDHKSKVVIFGSGPVGMIFVAFSKILGADPIIMVGLRDERLALAHNFGADFVINSTKENLSSKISEYTEGTGATHVVIAVSDYYLINDSFEFLSKEGRIGIYGSGSQEFLFNWGKTHSSWSLHNISYSEKAAHKRVIDSIRMGFINPKSFYSHTLPLENIDNAFNLLESKKALKIVIKIN